VFDLGLYGNTIYFDSQANRSFSITEKFGFLDKEKHAE
jgi:hypothetical protein